MTPSKDPKKSGSGLAIGRVRPLPLTDALEGEFLRFMEFHSAERFSRNLRKMLLEFLMYDGALEAIYLRELLNDMDGLFDLLDAIHMAKGAEEE